MFVSLKLSFYNFEFRGQTFKNLTSVGEDAEQTQPNKANQRRVNVDNMKSLNRNLQVNDCVACITDAINFTLGDTQSLSESLKAFLSAFIKRYPPRLFDFRSSWISTTTSSYHEPLTQANEADMDIRSSKPTPLGTLAKLPTELRLDIFNRILPEDFKQVYNITGSGFVYCPHQSSPKPRYFNISRQIREEMTAAKSNHRKVTIGLRTITTDFIANTNTNDAKTSVLVADELTACTMLEITIVRPSPRSVTGFAQLRSNVHDFVDLLLKSTAIIPKLAVRLEYSHPVDRGQCGSSDFAVLMGPFFRLRTKPCRGVMMYRTTGSPIWSPEIEQQCDLIEHTIKAASDTNILQYQQYMLDIKIALIFPLCDLETTLTWGEKEVLQPKLALRAHSAGGALTEWCRRTQRSVPRWVAPFLVQTTTDSCIVASELRDEILGAQDSTMLKCWLSGHMRAYNPIWDEHM